MKALYWIGGIAVVIALIAFGGMRLFSDLEVRSDSAAAFADVAVAAASKAWEPKSIEPFADQRFYESLQNTTPSPWETYAILGAAADPIKCSVVNIEIVNGLANALALCPGKFEHGSGTVQVSVTDYSGEWRVIGLKLQL